MFRVYVECFKRTNHTDHVSFKGLVCALCFNSNLRVHVLIEKMRKTRFGMRKMMITSRLAAKYGVSISLNAVIGDGLLLPHPDGVIIGQNARIGKNCTIYQQVTIGQKNGEYPTLGDNVTIYPGAKVIGGITVGDQAVIGANAVVLKDIPCCATAVGCPAKVLTKD